LFQLLTERSVVAIGVAKTKRPRTAMWSTRQYSAILFLLLSASLQNYIQTFSPSTYSQSIISNKRTNVPWFRITHDKTVMNLLWFGKDKKKEQRDGDIVKSDKGQQQLRSTDMGETVSTMENFKKAQDIGKRTSTVLQELSSMMIEGVAADGKVRIFVDGQQRPTGADIDEKYLASVTVDDLNTAVTAAMQDAHIKSTEQMEEKMQALYAEVGLPPPQKPKSS